MAQVNIPVPRLDFRERPFWSWVAVYFLIGWFTSYPQQAALAFIRCYNGAQHSIAAQMFALNDIGCGSPNEAVGWLMQSLMVILWPLGVLLFLSWPLIASLVLAGALAIYSVRQASGEARSSAQWRRRTADKQQEQIGQLYDQLGAANTRASRAERALAHAEDERDAALAQLRSGGAQQRAEAGTGSARNDNEGPGAGR